MQENMRLDLKYLCMGTGQAFLWVWPSVASPHLFIYWLLQDKPVDKRADQFWHLNSFLDFWDLGRPHILWESFVREITTLKLLNFLMAISDI